MSLTNASCAFCHGEGTDPYGIPSWHSSCAVCGGDGALRIPEEHTTCAYCGGEGSFKRLICTVCHGSGVVRRSRVPTQTCSICGGSGHESRNPTLDCLSCRGRGWVPASLQVPLQVQVPSPARPGQADEGSPALGSPAGPRARP